MQSEESLQAHVKEWEPKGSQLESPLPFTAARHREAGVLRTTALTYVIGLRLNIAYYGTLFVQAASYRRSWVWKHYIFEVRVPGPPSQHVQGFELQLIQTLGLSLYGQQVRLKN